MLVEDEELQGQLQEVQAIALRLHGVAGGTGGRHTPAQARAAAPGSKQAACALLLEMQLRDRALTLAPQLHPRTFANNATAALMGTTTITTIIISNHCHNINTRAPSPPPPPPPQAHHQLLASLRSPAHSASSRQLLALEAWTLRLALCHAASGGTAVPALQPRSQQQQRRASAGGAGRVAAGPAPALAAAVQRLGGRVQALEGPWAGASPSGRAAGAAPGGGGAGPGGAYDLLPSSGEEEEGREGRRRAKEAKRARKARHREGKRRRKEERARWVRAWVQQGACVHLHTCTCE